jgi:hypothetical protein
MSLRENIKRVLREESKRDLTSVMETLLDGFVNDHKDVICGVKIKHPDVRTKLQHSDNNYKNYRIDFYFIGGPGTKYFPRTQAVNRMYEDLMDEAWNIVYHYTEQPLDMFSKYTESCE